MPGRVCKAAACRAAAVAAGEEVLKLATDDRLTTDQTDQYIDIQEKYLHDVIALAENVPNDSD